MSTESLSPGQIKHAEKKAVPKFASFNPNPPFNLQVQESSSSEAIALLPKKHADAPDKSVARPKAQRQTSGRHHPWGHSGGGKANPHVGFEPAGPDRGPGESRPKSFVVDRLGDPNNLHFGAAHRSTTASYSRIGAGNVVGSHTSQKIDRAASTDKGLVLSDTAHGLPKKRDKHARWRLHQEGAREFKIKPQEGHDAGIDLAADYVSLETAQRAKRRRGDYGVPVDHVSYSDDDVTHYRSIEGKAKFENEPADRDLKYNSDTSSSQDVMGRRLLTLDDSTQEERAQLSRKVDAEPTSFEAWINLIDHQDKMLGLDENLRKTRRTNAERCSNAKIKLSMFEKALEKVQDSQGREVLLLGMMQEAATIWGIDKISSGWKSILRQNSHSLRLWTKYLDFMQASFTYFRFGEVQSVYLECLELIKGARISGEGSSDEPDNLFDVQMYVVLRMTLFMRESGFAEHATAAWQALLEFVFFKPIIGPVSDASDRDRGGSSPKDTVSMFETFWDSEVPRIGEEGAQGWASFPQKHGEPPRPTSGTGDDAAYGEDRWHSWLASERRRTLLSRHPARAIDDDVGEDDPYRIVLFSDIRPFLIDPPSLADRQLILDAFNVFCCLPPVAAQGPDSRSRVWGRDPFLRNDALRLNGKLQRSWKLYRPTTHQSLEERDGIDEDDARSHSGTQDPFQFPVRDYQVSSDTLFAEQQWFGAFDAWQEQCLGDGGPVEVAWVLRTLKSLVGVGAGEETLAVYLLALELRTSPGTVRRSAKNMLRGRPFSVRLYNAYALVEYRLADSQKGQGVIITSINMGKKFDEVCRRDSILLWRTWIWETLRAGSAQEALVRLLAIGDEEIRVPFPELDRSGDLGSVEPTLLLRTERALIATLDHALSLNSYSHATFAMECLILFAYLSKAQSISAATSAFKSNIALVSTRCPSSSEYLHQSFARLIHHHATHIHLFKPSEIRSLLAESIAQFPQNTVFLSLYAWNEARFRIDDRVRSIVKELVLGGSDGTKKKTQDSVVLRFFAIYSELHRGVTLGSNISTIRSTFERAVESDSGAHCAGLWKLYFLFEHSRLEAERAKTVFWRGLRACPWAKDLYMLAFEHLRGEKAMGEADLGGIYQLLVEKELRVHVGLEAIL